MLVACFAMVGSLFVRAQDVPVLSLGVDDVHKAVVLVTKPNEIVLEVTYSKPKQAEFLKVSQEGLPKKIKIVLNGQAVSERTITQPLTGHSIKLPMTTLDDAFAQAEALIRLPAATVPAPASATTAQPGDAPVFSVSSESIAKFAVFMYKPATVWMDLTLGDKEKADLAELVAKSPGKKIQLSVNGASLGVMEIGADKVGSSVRVSMASMDQAMAAAKAVMSDKMNGK